MLGHEIGHILNGDRPAHFQANRINDIVSSSSLDQKKELGADAWFVQHLQQDPQRQSAVENTLLNLLYAQVRQKIGSKNLFPATGVPITDQWIEYARMGTHPEFVVRATRMLSLSFDRPETINMKRQIDGFAKSLRERK